jgi:ribosome-binding protein aMBF1 (putative translation factor)
MVLNRSRRAREHAGLSVGQAARMLRLPIDQLCRIEENDAAYADSNPPRLADLYGVNVEWLSGRTELCDYVPIKTLANADRLSFRDRDMLAELYASLPRRR